MRILGVADTEECARIVRAGGVVAYPTDTVYGLGCDPFNGEAVRRLVAAKGERNKPLPVLVDGAGSAEGIAVLTETARALIERFWPGALTIVVRKKDVLPDELTLGPSVGVRCPGSAVALRLVRSCGGLLVGTSANLTGRPSCRSAAQVREQVGDRVDAILDGGTTPGTASTVVRVVEEGVEVIREGAIPVEEIAEVVPVRG